jgi:hypothetical protein
MIPYFLALVGKFIPSLARSKLIRAMLHEWKATDDVLSPSTINVKLSAARRLVGKPDVTG